MYSAGKRFSFSFAIASDRINGRFFPHASFVIACQKFVRCTHRKGLRKHFAHLQANGGRKIPKVTKIWRPRRTPEMPDVAPPTAQDLGRALDSGLPGVVPRRGPCGFWLNDLVPPSAPLQLRQ
jgi:hypothetical protein